MSRASAILGIDSGSAIASLTDDAIDAYDLKYLEDPEGVYGESDDIHWMSRKDFADEDPWLTAELDEWYMDDDTLGGGWRR